ncbi:hypothetical protein BTA51_01075 [Hahella sp. CCB-MM4]|uniref:DUF6010 family protein n=1 Tax=Hahella sp. (strain CCB-MM4) TaxID=1926491 RepID=UPI000B9C0F56|nr:DUF6010 family protein [Hahella sp. CCB-MM4]OZG75024.1 hypothetical protein BTA51_01075 [Hahella sp. CCB-MM4]
MSNFAVWLLLGAVATIPLVLYAHKREFRAISAVFGWGLIVAALIYVGFALLIGDWHWLLIEALGIVVYSLFFLISKVRTVLWVAAGWLAHPLWDVALHLQGPGYHVAPAWYAVACISFDFVVAGYIYYRYWKEKQRALQG